MKPFLDSNMLDKFLKEVVSIVVGKSAEEIADILNTPKHVNEFTISTKLDITINQTRNILYKLSDFGLVSHIRKKDKKKGWYTYFWKIEVLRALEFLKEEKVKRLGQMNNQVYNRENQEFYICERCNIEATEENALLQDFTCPECGEVFTRKDNTKLIKELKKNADKVTNEIVLIDKEIEKERINVDKIRMKESKKEDKKASKLRKEKAKKRKEAKAAIKKPAKKSAKKPSKKKVAKKSSKKKQAKKKVSKKIVKKKAKKSAKKSSNKKRK